MYNIIISLPSYLVCYKHSGWPDFQRRLLLCTMKFKIHGGEGGEGGLVFANKSIRTLHHMASSVDMLKGPS